MKYLLIEQKLLLWNKCYILKKPHLVSINVAIIKNLTLS